MKAKEKFEASENPEVLKMFRPVASSCLPLEVVYVCMLLLFGLVISSCLVMSFKLVMSLYRNRFFHVPIGPKSVLCMGVYVYVWHGMEVLHDTFMLYSMYSY